MILCTVLNTTEAIYQCLLFLCSKNGGKVPNRGHLFSRKRSSRTRYRKRRQNKNSSTLKDKYAMSRRVSLLKFLCLKSGEHLVLCAGKFDFFLPKPRRANLCGEYGGSRLHLAFDTQSPPENHRRFDVKRCRSIRV